MKTKNKVMTIGDLKAFAKRRARLNFQDYRQRELYLADYNQIRRAQYRCKKIYFFHREEIELNEGKYFSGRLIIKDGQINYIAGQYEPTEIWWAVLDYLEKRLVLEQF